MNGPPRSSRRQTSWRDKEGREDAARESRNADDLPNLPRPARDFTPDRALSLKTGPSVGSSIGEVKKSEGLYTGPPRALRAARDGLRRQPVPVPRRVRRAPPRHPGGVRRRGAAPGPGRTDRRVRQTAGMSPPCSIIRAIISRKRANSGDSSRIEPTPVGGPQCPPRDDLRACRSASAPGSAASARQSSHCLSTCAPAVRLECRQHRETVRA